MITFLAFAGLLGLTLIRPKRQQQFRTKSRQSWMLDLSGLFVQGVLIPWLQIAVVYRLYQHLLPNLEHAGSMPAIATFLLSFVAVDYLYYWNHRALHSARWWPIHQVHHTVTDLDVLGTSRNTLWSSFFLVYLWVHALFLYLLADPTGYILGVSLSNALDLWRHSEAHLPDRWNRWLAPWLILPQDHGLHHSHAAGDRNFGANLKLWDRLHGTVASEQSRSEANQLGVVTDLPLLRQLFWPFSVSSKLSSQHSLHRL